MYSIKNESIKNLTQEDINNNRSNIIKDIEEEDFIYFKSPAERHLITVFTDVDCGYCRKFHKEIESYNLKGISVRYLAFPRSGIGNDSYNKMVSAWCSKDRNQSLSQYKEDIQKNYYFVKKTQLSHIIILADFRSYRYSCNFYSKRRVYKRLLFSRGFIRTFRIICQIRVLKKQALYHLIFLVK